MIPIFFTESDEEKHLPNFDVEVIPITFVVNVDISQDDFHYPNIEGMLEMCNSDRILIFAHDCDSQGELLSSLLYHSFLKKGVSKDRMIRMPLTDDGIGYIGTFYSKEELAKLKTFYILERLYMNKYKSIGFKKSIMMKHLFYLSENENHKVQNINPHGTNTVTEITKILLGEYDE